MAFTGSAMCTSFKEQLMIGAHDFTNAADSFKMSLYDNSATLTLTTTVYTASGELASAGNYTTAGNVLDNNLTPTSGSGEAWTDWDDEVWGTATFSAYGGLIYNDTHATDAAVAVIDFGGVKTATAGDFTVQFPAPAATTAIIRIA